MSFATSSREAPRRKKTRRALFKRVRSIWKMESSFPSKKRTQSSRSSFGSLTRALPGRGGNKRIVCLPADGRVREEEIEFGGKLDLDEGALTLSAQILARTRPVRGCIRSGVPTAASTLRPGSPLVITRETHSTGVGATHARTAVTMHRRSLEGASCTRPARGAAAFVRCARRRWPRRSCCLGRPASCGEYPAWRSVACPRTSSLPSAGRCWT